MLFLHAENLEQTELFFSSFCQKTVAVDQKNHREQANDIGSHPHHCQDRIFSDHGIKATSLRQCIHDKKHHHRADARQQIRKDILTVFAQICFCQSGIQQIIHPVHHPSQELSAYRRSSDTSHRALKNRDTAGGRPRRP